MMFAFSYELLLLVVGCVLAVSYCKMESNLFQVHSNIDLQNIHSEVLSSASYTQCTMACRENCTAVVYKQNEGRCEIYRVPSNLLSLTKKPVSQNVETLVIRPCQLTPSICLNGGVCRKNETMWKGYICECFGDWGGEHCERSKNRCPWTGFAIQGETCYYVSGTWDVATGGMAEEKCSVKGARLSVGSNQEMWSTLRDIAFKERDWFLVALRKVGGIWKWSDNSTAFISWKLPTEPSGDGDCASTFPNGSGLNDAPCSFPRRFICERKPTY